MRFFANLSIRLKLVVGFLVMILFMGAIGLSGISGVTMVNKQLNDIFFIQLPSMDNLIEVDRDLHELLVAERSMIFANVKSDLFASLVRDYEQNLRESSLRWEKYKALVRDADEEKLVGEYEAARAIWVKTSRKIVDGRLEDSRRGRRLALDLALGRARVQFAAMRGVLDELTRMNLKKAALAQAKANQVKGQAIGTIMATLVVGFGAGVLLMLVISAVVTVPLKRVIEGLKDISKGEGNLTKRLPVGGKDELGTLSLVFNGFLNGLHSMILDISKSTALVSDAAKELRSISRDMLQGSRTTSDRSRELSASAGQMAASMSTIAENMGESSFNANSVASAAEEMTATVNEIAQNTDQAREISQEAVAKMNESSDRIKELESAARGIDAVVETISDISGQVNLLSLNATIEAARAGDAGKGFAVVASEIKELARQTSEASSDIKEKIENIQSSSRGALSRIDDISQVNTQVNDIVSMIAAAVEEQSTVTREIAQNIHQTSNGISLAHDTVGQSAQAAGKIEDDISQVNRSAMEMSQRSQGVDQSASELARIAEQLTAMVGRFQV